MSDWVSLNPDLPKSLKEDAAYCACSVWSDLGGVNILALDNWWHCAKLSYIPPHPGLNQPQALILNCVEGAEEGPRKNTKYTIDLQRRRVKVRKDSGDVEYADIPNRCHERLDRIEEWVMGIPAREERERQRREEQEEGRRQAAKKKRRELDRKAEEYEERLRGGGNKKRKTEDGPTKTPKTEPEEWTYDLGMCQVCGTCLMECKGTNCGLLSCPKQNCEGQGADQLRTCNEHGYEVFCSGCRDLPPFGSNMFAPLIACPGCDKFFCAINFLLCDGKDPTNLAAEKRHEVKPICCTDCAKSTKSVNFVRTCKAPRCPHEYPRPNRESASWKGGFCMDCACIFGLNCLLHPERGEWWCNACESRQRPKCPRCNQKTCPLLQHRRCDRCNNIDACVKCRYEFGTGSDELAEHRDSDMLHAEHGSESDNYSENTDNDSQDSASNKEYQHNQPILENHPKDLETCVRLRCKGCKSITNLCSACMSSISHAGPQNWCDCGKPICDYCSVLFRCPDSDCKHETTMCEHCGEGENCPGCGGPSESAIESMHYYEEDPMGDEG